MHLVEHAQSSGSKLVPFDWSSHACLDDPTHAPSIEQQLPGLACQAVQCLLLFSHESFDEVESGGFESGGCESGGLTS